MALDPGRRIGAYEIVGPLGSGGMGEVYRARDTRLGRLVAIKLVSGDVATDRSAHERLEREARLTSSLNHPNIVTVYDIGEVDGQPFIVMELVVGETLHARMTSRRLKLKEVIAIGAQIAEGLAAAHGAGVVHRDLKPRNIMLTGDGRAKILDFGLGKLALTAARSNDPTVQVPDLTDSRAVVGTAGYMAPEQVTNGRIDHQTDQFAFGAILYEMLTGERAFKRDSPIQTMAAVVEDEPTPILEHSPTVPHELVAIVQRCLEKDPARRYASTLDLARDLEDARSGFTPSPWPTPKPEPAPRPVDPRPLPKRGVIAAGLAVAVVALLWIWWPFGPYALDEARRLLYRWDEADNVERAIALLLPATAEYPEEPMLRATLAEAYVRQYEKQPQPARDSSLIDRARVEVATALRYADFAPAHVVQAMIDNLQGRPEAALEAVGRALDLNIRSGDAYRERGRAYVALGDLDRATEELGRAVTLAPEDRKDWMAHHYRGVAYNRLGRNEDAAAEFRQAVELAPAFARAVTNLGGVLQLLGRTDEAIDVLKQAAERCQCATAYSNLATTYHELGREDDAIEAYEQAVRMADARAEHYRNLGAATHWKPDLSARSREAYEESAVLAENELYYDPENQLLLAGLADAYAVLGHRDEAALRLAELEALGPTDGSILFQMGSVYEQLGDRARALDWLERAVAAGVPLSAVERSPWLEALRQDDAYRRRFGGN